MLRRLRKGQSTAEYAIVIGLVIAAAVGMQIYVKRGIQGKIKSAVNWTVPDTKVGSGKGAVTVHVGAAQYEPYYATTQDIVTTRVATETAETKEGGSVVRLIVGEDVSSRTGKQITLATE